MASIWDLIPLSAWQTDPPMLPAVDQSPASDWPRPTEYLANSLAQQLRLTPMSSAASPPVAPADSNQTAPSFWDLVPANPWERGNGLLPQRSDQPPQTFLDQSRPYFMGSSMDAPLLENADARDGQTSLPQPPSGNAFGSPINSGANENGPLAFGQSSNVASANPGSAILNTVSGTGNNFSLVPSARAQPANPPNNGRIFVLPDGSSVSDPYFSPNGYMMSPVADLSPVAAAGQRVGATYRQMLANSVSAEGPLAYLVRSLSANVAHGGTFDYQRNGKQFVPEFIGVSNFNVGLFCQQAGLSLDETLWIAGQYARLMSRNYTPGVRYGLSPKTRPFIEAGFRAGQSGMFSQAGP